MQDENKVNEKLLNLSKNLRALRTAKNETQISLSYKLGIDSRGYQRMESENPPDIKFTTIVKILDFYGISFEELIK